MPKSQIDAGTDVVLGIDGGFLLGGMARGFALGG